VSRHELTSRLSVRVLEQHKSRTNRHVSPGQSGFHRVGVTGFENDT
jgi:hypothetical protein